MGSFQFSLVGVVSVKYVHDLIYGSYESATEMANLWCTDLAKIMKKGSNCIEVISTEPLSNRNNRFTLDRLMTLTLE